MSDLTIRWTNNLDVLNKAEKKLTERGAQLLRCYVLGAVSVYVDADQWASIVADGLGSPGLQAERCGECYYCGVKTTGNAPAWDSCHTDQGTEHRVYDEYVCDACYRERQDLMARYETDRERSAGV